MRINSLPAEIIKVVKQEQIAQGITKSGNIDLELNESVLNGNFSWYLSKDGPEFWRDINAGNYNTFWPKYGWAGYEKTDPKTGTTYTLKSGLLGDGWFFSNKNQENDNLFTVRQMDKEYVSRIVLGHYSGGVFPSCKTPEEAIKLFDAVVNKNYIPKGNELMDERFESICKKVKTDICNELVRLNTLVIPNTTARNLSVDAKNKRISFLPKEKVGSYKGSTYLDKNRQDSKIGKVIRGVLMDNGVLDKFTDADLELTVDRILAVADRVGGFVLIEGPELAKYYSERQHHPKINLGSLGGSCMRKCPSEYFDIYSLNPDLVKMLVLFKDEKVIGRALIWDGKYMDRVYGNGPTQQKFFTYAAENGLYRKYRQTFNDRTNWVDPKGKQVQKTIKLKLNKIPSKFPYLDTFTYGNLAKKTISNSKAGMSIYMQDLHGGYGNL